ncbi:hypothetical protein MBM_05623 [Drepanopeziza brunnea f. sp. 'multigermtubi' MB_m1]|uniref:Uncharacterized protein n=1 Tax=Marssonina brunnea f. sp. multigermtubi (strain MB_m1) TaxID=1072389 RepID=K1XUF3_MARBU|nr:uncharacterized protein MBM_05623 [Drepanopeziza brunnea f. sp. 'multigermtubi' MB_m1]EKD16329.1 hypothetical protein MBM_05623 [Drepanopeziza brunnea f. sp. 'multigermtubi' MB_m1]
MKPPEPNRFFYRHLPGRDPRIAPHRLGPALDRHRRRRLRRLIRRALHGQHAGPIPPHRAPPLPLRAARFPAGRVPLRGPVRARAAAVHARDARLPVARLARDHPHRKCGGGGDPDAEGERAGNHVLCGADGGYGPGWRGGDDVSAGHFGKI